MPGSDSPSPSVPKTAPSKEETKAASTILLQFHVPYDSLTAQANGKSYSQRYAAALATVEQWFVKRYDNIQEEESPMNYRYHEITDYDVPGMMVTALAARVPKITEDAQCAQLIKSMAKLADEVKMILPDFDPIYFSADDYYEVQDV